MIGEKPVLLWVAAGLAGLSVFAFGWLGWRRENARRALSLDLVLREKTVITRPLDRGEDRPSVWSSRSSAVEERFDLFTAPDLWFDSHAKSYSVRSLPEDAEERVADEAGLAFAEIVPRPYRIRLIGHQGGPGAWRGCFVDDETGEMASAGVGGLQPLRLEVLRLDLQRAEVDAADTIQFRKEAVAVVRDFDSGREITLREGEGVAREESDVGAAGESR